MEQQRVIVITGPTASGKSALPLALAERRRGVVINADAMQTYDALPILTAQPGAEERARVPHRLYGRAWEVWAATGRPLSAWQTSDGQPAPWRFATVLLAPERDWLRQRIAGRFDAMLQAGVLAEVRAVFDRAADPRWPGLKAHGA